MSASINSAMISFKDLADITSGKVIQLVGDKNINHLVIDSRKAIASEDALFFAIAGERHDGHLFIEDLYQSGMRQFIVEKEMDVTPFPEGNFLKVDSAVTALQKISAFHRSQFEHQSYCPHC